MPGDDGRNQIASSRPWRREF